MIATAVAYDEGPISFRYPRGEGVGVEMPERGKILEIGKGQVVREGTKVALVSFGSRLQDCLTAAQELETFGLSTTVANARFAKPLDTELLKTLALEHELLITVEEGSSGGFGALALHFLAGEGLLDHGLKVRTMTMPDIYMEQMSPARMIAVAELDAKAIVNQAVGALEKMSNVVSIA